MGVCAICADVSMVELGCGRPRICVEMDCAFLILKVNAYEANIIEAFACDSIDDICIV